MTKKFYTYEEFLEVCSRMQFTSRKDYLKRYRIDPKLPSLPSRRYYNFRWTTITGNSWMKDFYTYTEFLEVCSRMQFTSQKDYAKRYKEDPKLPYHPGRIYPGFKWSTITGNTECRTEFYTYQEFLKVCRTMQFTSYRDYLKRYREDTKLPSNPHNVYPGFKFSTVIVKKK